MKKSDIYDGISRINEKYRVDSENFEEIALEFKRVKIRKIGKAASFAASLAIAVIIGVKVYDKNMINNSSMIKPSGLEENSHITTETAEITESEQIINDTAENEKKYIVTSSNAISDIFKTNINDTIQAVYDINEASEYDDSISDETVIIISDPAEKTDIDTEKPVTAIPEPTEKPNTVIEKPAVTITDTTEKPDNDVSADPPEQKPLHWEEMNITQQYFMCTFEDIYYKTMNKATDSVLIGEYLGIAEMDGYDQYNDRYYHCNAKVYEIKGISKTDSVSVLFENETEFFTYTNYKLISKDR